MSVRMAQQFSLFAAPDPASQSEPEKASARQKSSHSFDPETLPIPPKLGIPTRSFGTSSWVYPGWDGGVYRSVKAYGASSRFSDLCLAEYARNSLFRSAGADNMYYVRPSQRRKLLQKYASQLRHLPEKVELCPKVFHELSVSRYTPQQQAEWRLLDEINPHFLDPRLFLEEVAQPLCDELGELLGPLILELQENDIHEADFCRLLDHFLQQVRKQFSGPLSVELRTESHFTSRYLSVLATHGVSHVLNSWTKMPSIGQQFALLQQSQAKWPFYLLRALLPQGVRYAEASKWAPYDRLRVRADSVRKDMLQVLRSLKVEEKAYVLVNNHLEGHAPTTVAEIQHELFSTDSL
ncbi:MAG TPA: DUF72 domain-containing protein [Pseudomonadota bacterium]|nr:DUF72 domain-containing protein [Pseudomonadota bacterium]HNK47072.1 DUF72 domain-containing protein [Pseudomonadota bacterium]